MTLELIRDGLAWCAVINIGVLLLWFLGFTLFHDWICRVHGKWFHLTAESFDVINYAIIVFFKMVIFVFNVVPYLALRLVG